MPGKLKIGILGVGSIGQTVANAIDRGSINVELVAICDQDASRAEGFAAVLSSRPPMVSMDELIDRTDLVVEAAGQAALCELVPKALARRRDLLILSVGGLLGHNEWFLEAEEKGCRIYIPSGAIAGLDGIKSASMGRIDCAVLTSRKPAAALRGTKYVAERGIAVDEMTQETIIFDGTAEEAARAFPTTSNVAASLRLSVDPKVPVRVRVMAVPGGTQNVHEIRVKGEFGELAVDVKNVPSRANPRTSQLAAFSALATLANLTRTLRVGN
ncbi:MAG TPA: aspartate dehydrogenase domain-containing protein [Candidatus Acidoferrales bacterium]|nr:aspartate dehydrogenase domain-containing protein [Candidatus Acidoferrales bacterium]